MIGIGGSTIEKELNAISTRAHLINSIPKSEFQSRIDKACKLMHENSVSAMYLHSGTNLYYFTGMRWSASERMVGAVLFENGTLIYLAPEFEKGTILDFMQIEGDIKGWEEHESPFQLLGKVLAERNLAEIDLYIDETTPFFITDGIDQANSKLNLVNAKSIISECRMIKSPNEIAIMQHVMDITLDVQKATARILKIGISAKEVTDFINEAHKRYGIASGSYFCIILFGKDSSFPHGVRAPKNLELNDVVLVDTGCVLHGYISDITRTYVFGEVNEEQRRIWDIEKQTQLAAFDASQLEKTCASIDDASRLVLESHGLGPDYKLPGLPHRTGHGIGLDIHEYPYIVRGNNTRLKPGMCFSNEPMLCVPNKFGIRLEDHIYMTNDGPKWFTEPSHSIENPFGL